MSGREILKLLPKPTRVHALFAVGIPTRSSAMAEGLSKKLADLHQAARDGDTDTVISLIGDGFEMDCRDKHRRTPLHLAAWAGHAGTVKALVGAGCNLTAAALDDTNALHFACQKNRQEVARILLNAGKEISG